MEDIIKTVLQIDKDAIKKQQMAKDEIEEQESQKKIMVKKLKEDITSQTKEEIDAYKKLADSEIEIEAKKIKQESEEKSKRLTERYEQIADKVIEDAFNIVIDSLEG